MADHTPTLANGTKLAPNHEIFPRDSAGQMGQRLGFIGDIVPALSVYVERVVERRDDTAIIGAMREMLGDDRLLDLKLRYQSILDSLQTYADHGQEHTVIRTQHLCTEAAPAFEDSFEKALEAIAPNRYVASQEQQVRAGLAPLIAAADAYVIVLSIGFHTCTVLTPSTAHQDRVVRSQIEHAIKLLEDRLQGVLIPSWGIPESAMAALLLRGHDEKFEYYYQFCRGYEGVGGVLRLVTQANKRKGDSVDIHGQKNNRWDGYESARPYSYWHLLVTADVLIEIIGRFKHLLNTRLSYKAGGAPFDDPTAITAEPAQDAIECSAQKLEK